MPSVILFDVDGTLIRSGGAARQAIERAMGRAFGPEARAPDFSFAGMTDRAIVRRSLEAQGLPSDAPQIQRFFDVYLEILREEVEQASEYRVLPGIVAGLEALAARADRALGLGTGNVEKGARIKLERVALNEYFAFGGFGCDHEDRGRLLQAGAERGAHRLGRPLDSCRIGVVGDTPKDVAAARTVGARCLAVATGGASWQELEACAPDYLFESLAAPGALDALLEL